MKFSVEWVVTWLIFIVLVIMFYKVAVNPELANAQPLLLWEILR